MILIIPTPLINGKGLRHDCNPSEALLRLYSHPRNGYSHRAGTYHSLRRNTHELLFVLEGRVLSTIRHQSSKLLEVTLDIAFLLLLASHLFQKLLLLMEGIELCVHQPSALLQLREFNGASLVGIQKPGYLRVRQLDLRRQLLPLFAQASLFSILPVNPALPIRF